MANQTCNSSNHEENFSTPAKTANQHALSSVSKVRVVVRVRPFLLHEISSSNQNPISCISLLNSESKRCVVDEVTVHIKDQETRRNECYKLDAFFEQEDNNVSQIFEKEVEPLIPDVFRGCNATVFAYGATGSGKTYTMQGNDELPGLMRLAISTVLSLCKSTGSSIAISYYEIYLERCYDLLELKDKEILVWEDKYGQIHLKGLVQVEINSIFEFNEIFSSVVQRRKVAQTALNDVSSRSHGVLVINITTPSHENAGNAVTGKLNLIDLAGNEDNGRTCNEGVRLQESSKINQSLFVLSNVIYALNNSMTRVPYRESKLTRILQDSLGGTSRALMIACLNPGEYQESVRTVSLAARSRHVSNLISSAHKNSTPSTKVNMEAKLRAWLESKGKTKSAQNVGPLRSPFTSKTPCSVAEARRSNQVQQSTGKKVVNSTGARQKQRTPCTASRNLFNDGGFRDPPLEAYELTAAENMEETFAAPTSVDTSERSASVTDKPAKKEALGTKESSPVCPIDKAFQSPQRKALSPMNSNTDILHLVPSDPKTPKSYCTLYNGENNLQAASTPLDKLNARGSSLKSSLVQDYIEFLNTASREELVELKGIGQKIAEYIIELRETSPLKSLTDLEKIGFSSKQVHNMFGMVTRGMFERIGV